MLTEPPAPADPEPLRIVTEPPDGPEPLVTIRSPLFPLLDVELPDLISIADEPVDEELPP